MDFEYSIHMAFSVQFKISGCYFHFSQALWRRVQFAGCTTLYITERSFNTFFRMLVAIPFLPLVEINTALEELAIFSFNPVHPSLSKMEDFRDKILEYFTRFGVFNKLNCL